jgi:hypothetical protein
MSDNPNFYIIALSAIAGWLAFRILGAIGEFFNKRHNNKRGYYNR